jgi:hypothetical protein
VFTGVKEVLGEMKWKEVMLPNLSEKSGRRVLARRVPLTVAPEDAT